MSVMFWIAVILTSPFWMVLGIVIIIFLFLLLIGLLMLIGEIWERICITVAKFFDLFRWRKGK